MSARALQSLAPMLREVPKPPPSLCGVYFVILADEIVYIGQSTNILQRLSMQRTKFKGIHDRIVWIQVDEAELDAYEGALVRAINPRFNGHCPKGDGRDDAILDSLGLDIDRDAGRAAYRARIESDHREAGARRSPGRRATKAVVNARIREFRAAVHASTVSPSSSECSVSVHSTANSEAVGPELHAHAAERTAV